MENAAVLPSWTPTSFLDEVRLVHRQKLKALSVWPLVPATPHLVRPAPTTTLSRALEDGLAGVEPVRAAGAFQRMRIENRGAEPLLVVAGEEISAELQTGSAATSLLVPPRASVSITLVPVDERRRSLQRDLLQWLRGARPVQGQLGLVAALGDRVLGLDLLGHGDVLTHLLPTLLASYWMQAISVAFRCGPLARPAFDAPIGLVAAVNRAQVRGRPSASLSRRLALEAPGIRGHALMSGGELVHLAARPL
jgi:hypothetical protein